ncbi:MAG: DUF6356 family protein [Pseudomonadota bacterium]
MFAMTARLFTKHPSSVDETYFQHLRFAAGFAFWLAMAALAALVHAILPFLFERTAGRIVERLYHRIHNRHAR